jgi:8-oxo-dGTP diphosphatase
MSRAEIEAAGVVLVRPGQRGPEVAVVHRPHRADWSLPKGKLEAGERHEAAAVRETWEETGVRGSLGPSLGGRRYAVDGVPKHVRYWRAVAHAVEHREPDAEIDEIRWLRRKAAKDLLTYQDDRALVDLALAFPDTTPTIILRHAEAMKRAMWRGSGDPRADHDASRPLSDSGVVQAHQLVEVLAAYRPDALVSSDARRCRSTIEPYAAISGLDVRLVHGLSEEGCADDPEVTTVVVGELLGATGSAVWCSHRPVLPIILRAVSHQLSLDGRVWEHALDPRLKPGAAIVLHRAPDGGVVAIDRIEG